MVNHIDYIVNLVGIDHVAIRTDIVCGYHAAFPIHKHYIECMKMKLATENMKGIERIEKWLNITSCLIKNGYSDNEITKIVGKNTLNLMKKIFD